MRFLIGSLIIVFSVCSCIDSNNKHLISHEYFDIVGDTQNDMSLWFKVKKDSAFFFYCNILEDGDYLNCPADSADYAGSFSLTEVRDSTLTLRIKNYRYDDLYLVKLKFYPSYKKIDWSVDSGSVGYLPKTAAFISRELRESSRAE